MGPALSPGNDWLERRSSHLTVVETELSGPPWSPLGPLHWFNSHYLHMALLGNSWIFKLSYYCKEFAEFVEENNKSVLETEIEKYIFLGVGVRAQR